MIVIDVRYERLYYSKNAYMKIEECNQGVAKTENIRRHRYGIRVLLRYIVFFRH